MRVVTGPTDKIVIVGAGLGGLACALRLAGAGRQVTVVVPRGKIDPDVPPDARLVDNETAHGIEVTGDDDLVDRYRARLADWPSGTARGR